MVLVNLFQMETLLKIFELCGLSTFAKVAY